MPFNNYDLNNLSLLKTGGLTECYLPLWSYSSGYVSNTAVTTFQYINKGTSATTSSSSSSTNLHTLSTKWDTSQQFAFEASIKSGTSPNTIYTQLYDFTANTNVGGASVSTSSVNFTVLRSAKFTLIPGHVYGVAIWSGVNGTTAYLTKASLIAFLS